MPTTLPPVLVQAPFVEPRSGHLTRTAVGWLQSSYLRQGGEFSATNTELAGGVAANAAHIGQVEDDLGQTQTTLAGLEAEVTALQAVVVAQAAALEALTLRVTTLEATVTTLEETVSEQETRLAALEAWKEALLGSLPVVLMNNSGGTANDTVSLVPTPAAAPATATALRDDLVNNVWPTLKDNYADLTEKINALRSAFVAS